MSDGPDDITDLAVGAITTSAAPTGESGGGGDGVDTSGLEAAPTPGEVMTELAPTSSDSAQNLYSEFNIDALAFANNPTINSYAVELKTEQMFEGQDDPHSEDLRSGSKTEEKDKKNRERAEALAEHFERMEAMQERQREWMERDHQVGGMHMSGRDLEGFLRVMGDPKKREQIAQKLREQGMSDNDVKKAEKEAQEFSRLKQLEKTRDLTDEEKKRLEEINKSEQFKKYTAATAEVAKEYGVDLPTMKTESGQKYAEFNKYTRSSSREDISVIQSVQSSLNEEMEDDAFVTASLNPQKGISTTFNSAQSPSSNVIELKQSIQDRTTSVEDTVGSTTPSNLDLIRENKTELLEPKLQKQPAQVIQVASAPSATAGLSF